MAVLDDRTGFKSEMVPFQTAEGSFRLVVIVKATYLLDEAGELHRAPIQEPLVLEDEYLGMPGASSLAKPSDLAQFKESTDVAVIGSAHAPEGREVVRMAVDLKVGTLHKRLVVSGDRRWERTIGGAVVMSAPDYFHRMPLVYERAFGGVDGVAKEERNPVGRGFNREPPPSGTTVANIEGPGALISRWTDRPAPEGFGFIAPDWQPRKSFVGTYDQAWLDEQFPLPPVDFDSRHFVAAHPDLRCKPHLAGDESVELRGTSPGGLLRFALPGLAIALSVQFQSGRPQRRLAALDTLTLKPDERKVQLVWRYAVECPRKILDVELITAFSLRLATLRRLSHAPRR
ncbi:conserved hypothetical protein [Burkholderiales bacterium 8X]|nr:conserved hypothetical protein [Burkholderiales bacterium 8X]